MRSVFLLSGLITLFLLPSLYARDMSPASPEVRPGLPESGLPESGDFKTYLAQTANDDDMVGLAVAIVRKGEVSFLETYGRRIVEGPDKIDPDTTFRIASLSKAFATSAFVQLAAEGKLSLSDKALRYAPKLRLKNPARLDALTLENILSHRTSLPPYAYDNLLEAGVARERILGDFRKVDPICPVGRCYAYQNVAFDVVADAIEAADGRRYSQSIEQRLFQPLKMEGASLGLENLKRSGNWARPHRRKRDRSWRAVTVKQPYYSVPAAGGVNANINDMAKWLIAQTGHAPDVLSGPMRKMMHAPRVATPAEVRRMTRMTQLKSAHYGLGWRIYDYAGHTVINHSGSVEGYSAQIAFLPEREVGIVLLTNSRSRPFWDILPTFLDMELATGSGPQTKPTGSAL